MVATYFVHTEAAVTPTMPPTTVTPIIPPTTVTPIPLLTWLCTGPYSDLDYRDCEGVYYITPGCYFLEPIDKYRPCAEICNDVVVNSKEDGICRSHCHGKKILKIGLVPIAYIANLHALWNWGNSYM